MKKTILALALLASFGTFAKTDKNKEIKVIKIALKKYQTSCNGVTFTYSAESNAEAVKIALRYCEGGSISILG